MSGVLLFVSGALARESAGTTGKLGTSAFSRFAWRGTGTALNRHVRGPNGSGERL